jgi:hypothetical protein
VLCTPSVGVLGGSLAVRVECHLPVCCVCACLSAQRRWLGVASDVAGGVVPATVGPKVADLVTEAAAAAKGTIPRTTRANIRSLRRALVNLAEGVFWLRIRYNPSVPPFP